MVPSARCPVGKQNIQHQHRHLVRRLHHGRDVHRSPALRRNHQRRPATEDLPIDGHPFRAIMARYLRLPGIQVELSHLRYPGYASLPPAGGPRGTGIAALHAAVETGVEDQCARCAASSLVSGSAAAAGEGSTGGSAAADAAAAAADGWGVWCSWCAAAGWVLIDRR